MPRGLRKGLDQAYFEPRQNVANQAPGQEIGDRGKVLTFTRSFFACEYSLHQSNESFGLHFDVQNPYDWPTVPLLLLTQRSESVRRTCLSLIHI